jgi:hypothetical protein
MDWRFLNYIILVMSIVTRGKLPHWLSPISFLMLLVCVANSVSQKRETLKTDRAVYQEKAPPALPRAGGTFTDPTFGTEIMRVTDENTTEDGGTYYSYWPTFNCNNTRLLVKTGREGYASVYEFDPTQFRLGSRRQIPRAPAGYLAVEGAIWSGDDPDVLYGLIGLAIYAYHPSSQSFTRVADFSDRFPSGDFLWQLSMSRHDEMFAFSRRRPNGKGGSDYVGYGAYRHSDNSLVLDQSIVNNDLDEVQIDKSGRWLVVKGETKTTKGFSIRDLQHGGSRKQLGGGPPDFAPGHSDNGTSFVSGYNNYQNTIDRRNFTNPIPILTELRLANDWSQGLHISQLGDDESWMLVSLYEVSPIKTPIGPFHNEIILVRTDGSGDVVRLLHHHSVYKEYWDTPRANVTRDGRFVAFTSNWGGRGRRDLFVARIPNLISPVLPPKSR